MLGKLIKYEFKASARLFLLLYAALILMSVINMALEPLRDMQHTADPAMGVMLSIVVSLFMFGYIVLVFAVALITLVVIIMRFYKNLLGDEGYLMFTLPVNTDSQIISKFVVSIVWCILSIAAVFGSLFILVVRTGFIDRIKETLDGLRDMGINIGAWSTGIAVALLIYMVCSIFMFYAAMAIGSNLTKNRLLGSFLGYMILYAINQGVGLISIIIPVRTGLFTQLEEFGNEAVPVERIAEFSNTVGFQLFLYVCIINLVMAVFYYFVTRYFIKNKLNLT